MRLNDDNPAEAFIATFTLNCLRKTSDNFLRCLNKELRFHLGERVPVSAPDITSMNKELQYDASCFVSVLCAAGEERTGLRNGLPNFNTIIIIIIIITLIIIISDGVFLPWRNNPSGPRPSHCRGFTITLSYIPYSVGVLWTSGHSNTETST